MSWNLGPVKQYILIINGKTFRGYHDGHYWNLYEKNKFCKGSGDHLIKGNLKNKKSLLVWIRCEEGCGSGEILITDLDGKKQRNFR